jgi:ketosteroid isomerase-like protein
MAPTEIVRQLIERVMEGARTGNFAPALALYAADVVITQEFAFPKPIVTQGKARLVAAIEARDPAHKPRMYANISLHDFIAHQTADPEVVVAEWTYLSNIGGHTVENRNIIVVRCRNGQIVTARDYHNHVTRAIADGTVPKLLETIAGLILPADQGALRG